MNNQREELLARLDHPDTPWEEMVSVLDELDEREGAVPFDTRAGWEDLMARTPKKRMRFGRLPLAAVIALVCLVITVAAGSFGLHQKLADFFGAGEEQSILLTEGISQPKTFMLPGAMDGVKIEILQVVADHAGIYALYEAEIPEYVDLPEEVAWREAEVRPPTESGTALAMGNRVLSVEGNTLTGLLNTFGFQSVLCPGRVTAHFEDLGYWEGETFVPLLEGAWHLYWKLDNVALGTTFALDQPIQTAAGAATVTNLTLSPVSARLEVAGAEIDTDRLYLEFGNGTIQTFPGEDSRSWGYVQRSDAAYIYAMFASAIHPDQVTAVIIEGNRVALHETAPSGRGGTAESGDGEG